MLLWWTFACALLWEANLSCVKVARCIRWAFNWKKRTYLKHPAFVLALLLVLFMSPICQHLHLIWQNNDPYTSMINNLVSPYWIVDPFWVLDRPVTSRLWEGAGFFFLFFLSTDVLSSKWFTSQWCREAIIDMGLFGRSDCCLHVHITWLSEHVYKLSLPQKYNYNFPCNCNLVFMHYCSFVAFSCLDFIASLHAKMHVATSSTCRIRLIDSSWPTEPRYLCIN